MVVMLVVEAGLGSRSTGCANVNFARETLLVELRNGDPSPKSIYCRAASHSASSLRLSHQGEDLMIRVAYVAIPSPGGGKQKVYFRS